MAHEKGKEGSQERVLVRAALNAIFGRQSDVLRRAIAMGLPANASSHGIPLTWHCISKRNVPALQMLLEEGADPNVVYGNYPLLNWASGAWRAEDLEMVNLLLAHGASPNLPDKAGYTTFHMALLNSRVEFMTTLISAGADVNATIPQGLSPLMYASTHLDPSIVKLLTTHGADVHRRGPAGQTALHMAARRSYFEVVEVLLAAGAMPLAKDDAGQTPMTLADDDRVKTLLFEANLRLVTDRKEALSAGAAASASPRPRRGI